VRAPCQFQRAAGVILADELRSFETSFAAEGNAPRVGGLFRQLALIPIQLDVYWGDQTWEEMNTAFLRVALPERPDSGGLPKRREPSLRRAATTACFSLPG
jgi:hypothetical protein